MSAVRRIIGLPLSPLAAVATPASTPRAQPPAGGTPTLASPVSWTASYEINKPVQAFC